MNIEAPCPERPSGHQLLARLKQFGFDGWADDPQEGAVAAYSFATTPGTYGAAAASVRWHRGWITETIEPPAGINRSAWLLATLGEVPAPYDTPRFKRDWRIAGDYIDGRRKSLARFAATITPETRLAALQAYMRQAAEGSPA